MLESLFGKRILVTGGATGIGAEIAAMLNYYGAKVGISYCSEDSLQFDKELWKFRADFLVNNSWRTLLNKFIEDFRGIDGLVNNAGAVFSDWDNNLKLNAEVPLHLTRSVCLYMKNNKEKGSVVNISSIAAKYGSPKHVGYAAAKAALENITKTYARKYAEYGIRVNAVRCGVIDTGLHKKIGRTNEDMALRMYSVPLGRLGTPADVAKVVCFLLSDASSFITRNIVEVTGGN